MTAAFGREKAADFPGNGTSLMVGSGSIGQDAETLRGEVDQFLIAMRDDAGERRKYERAGARGQWFQELGITLSFRNKRTPS